MTAYLSIFSARFRLLLQYRAAALAGFGTQFFWGLMKIMILTAFYASSQKVQPISLAQTITYVWLGQGFLLLFPWNVDGEVAKIIRSGDVCYEMVKPLDLYWAWYFRVIAMRTAPALLRCVPMIVIAGLFFNLTPPPSTASAVLFMVSICCSVLLSCAITVLIMSSFFWTVSGEGMIRLFPAFMMLTSGLIIPLPLLPDAVQPLLNILPFRGIMDVPFRLYLGNLTPDKAPLLILQQIAWTLIFILLGRRVLNSGLRRVVVQGG